MNARYVNYYTNLRKTMWAVNEVKKRAAKAITNKKILQIIVVLRLLYFKCL